MCGKIAEYVELEDSLLPMVGVGAVAASVIVCTLYVVSRCFDSDPYLFNGGKMGKLEARSTYNINKKCC